MLCMRSIMLINYLKSALANGYGCSNLIMFINGLLFRLFRWFYKRSSRIIILTSLWQKLIKFKKRRRWGVSRILHYPGCFILKVGCGYVDRMPVESSERWDDSLISDATKSMANIDNQLLNFLVDEALDPRLERLVPATHFVDLFFKLLKELGVT